MIPTSSNASELIRVGAESLDLRTPPIERAVEVLRVMTQSDIERERYEAREKAIKDYNSAMSWARDEGFREGLIEALEFGLELRFGEAGKPLSAPLREIKDVEQLKGIRQALRSASSVDEVRVLVEAARPRPRRS